MFGKIFNQPQDHNHAMELFPECLHQKPNDKNTFKEFPQNTISRNIPLSQSELYGIDCEADNNIQRQNSAETYDYMGD